MSAAWIGTLEHTSELTVSATRVLSHLSQGCTLQAEVRQADRSSKESVRHRYSAGAYNKVEPAGRQGIWNLEFDI